MTTVDRATKVAHALGELERLARVFAAANPADHGYHWRLAELVEAAVRFANAIRQLGEGA